MDRAAILHRLWGILCATFDKKNDQVRSVPNIIKIYHIFACLITKYWLSRSSSAASGELHDRVGSSPADAVELRNNQDIVIRIANMS